MDNAKGKKFHLYHQKSDTTVGNLNWTQTKCICLTLGDERVKEWHIYTEAFGDWKPLVEVIFEFVKFSGDKYSYPVPSVAALHDEQPPVAEALEIISDDRRDSPRFQRKLPLILDMDGYLIESETVDISVSGLKLKTVQKLASRPKYIMAMLKLEDSVIDLKLAPIYDDQRGRFQSLSCVGCSNINKWKGQQRDDHDGGPSSS